MLYAILGRDASGSLPKRRAARPAHLERLKALAAEGRLIIAGPLPAIDAPDPGPAGSVVYVFTMDPAVKGADYTVSTILAEAFPADAMTLLKQYAESYAAGFNFINLSLIQDLGK